jgi:hypothetical protein
MIKRFLYFLYVRYCMWRGVVPADPWNLHTHPDAVAEAKKQSAYKEASVKRVFDLLDTEKDESDD